MIGEGRLSREGGGGVMGRRKDLCVKSAGHDLMRAVLLEKGMYIKQRPVSASWLYRRVALVSSP